MSVLLSYGSSLYSQFRPPYVSLSTVSPTTPIENLTNGMLAQNISMAAAGAIAGAVDLGSAQTPDVAAIGNHSFTPGLEVVSIQASDDELFSSLIVDVLAVVAVPNFGVDLRAITPRTARFWRWRVTGALGTVQVGEFAVGAVDSVRTYSWGYTDTKVALFYEHGDNDYGALARTAQDIAVRARTATFRGPVAMADSFRAAGRHGQTRPGSMLFIPDDTDMSDVWFIDWDDSRTKNTLADSDLETEVRLQEHSPGIRSL